MLIGFATIAPIGMQNLYVFNNALSEKLSRALFFAIFIWLADALFELAAFFGMGALISTNRWLKLAVMGIGGILVIYIALGIIRGAKSNSLTAGLAQKGKVGSADEGGKKTLRSVVFASFLLVWANPQALIDGSLMLGALRGTMTGASAFNFIAGVLLATALWFFGITMTIGLLRDKLSSRILTVVNLASGLIVLVYGAYLLVHVVLIIF